MSGSTSHIPQYQEDSAAGPSSSTAFIDLTELGPDRIIPSTTLPSGSIEIVDISDDENPEGGHVVDDSDDSDDVEIVGETPAQEVQFISESPGQEVQFVREVPGRPRSRNRSQSLRHAFLLNQRQSQQRDRRESPEVNGGDWRGLQERIQQAIEAFRGGEGVDPNNLVIYYDRHQGQRPPTTLPTNDASRPGHLFHSGGSASGRQSTGARSGNTIVDRVLSSAMRTPHTHPLLFASAFFSNQGQRPTVTPPSREARPIQEDMENPFVIPDVDPLERPLPARMPWVLERDQERVQMRQQVRSMHLETQLEREILREMEHGQEMELEREREQRRKQKQREDAARAKMLPVARPGHTTALTPTTVIACPLCRKAFGQKGDDTKLFALTGCSHVVCDDCVEEIFTTKVEVKSPSRTPRTSTSVKRSSKGKAKAVDHNEGAGVSGVIVTAEAPTSPMFKIVKKGSGPCPSCNSRVRRCQVQQLYL